MTDTSRWQEAYSTASLRDPHRGGVCLDADELVAALEGRLSGERLDRAVIALAECPRCAALAQIAIDLRPDEAQTNARSQSAMGRTPRRRQWPWALAASLLLGIGATIAWPLLHPAADMAVRAPPGMQNAEPRLGARLDAAPLKLSWQALVGGGSYRVELYDDRAELMWTSPRVDAPSVELPTELRAQLRSGTFLWRVRAEGSDIEIGPFHFTVVP